MAIHLVTLKSYENEFTANLAVTRLSQYGIPAFINMENDVIMQPFSTTSSAIQLKVDEQFMEQALEILKNYEEEESIKAE
ncbi:MAG: DUF2007 domain-containing protein [Saprospiraceae bacterium]|nr:DUF2007 domain-containing protein [Saprospiraceae bacterium]